MQIWKKLWKLRVPNKINVFGWRACHEILPNSCQPCLKKNHIKSGVSLLQISFGIYHSRYMGVWCCSRCVSKKFNQSAKSVKPTNVILFSYLNFFLTSYLKQILSCFLFNHGLYGIKETRWCMEDK